MLLEFGHHMCHCQTLHSFDTLQLNLVYQVLLHACFGSDQYWDETDIEDSMHVERHCQVVLSIAKGGYLLAESTCSQHRHLPDTGHAREGPSEGSAWRPAGSLLPLATDCIGPIMHDSQVLYVGTHTHTHTHTHTQAASSCLRAKAALPVFFNL